MLFVIVTYLLFIYVMLFVISCEIVNCKYAELSIYSNIYLNVCTTGSFCIDLSTILKFQLNADNTGKYDIVFINSFQVGPNNFANNIFIQRFKIMLMFFILVVNVFASSFFFFLFFGEKAPVRSITSTNTEALSVRVQCICFSHLWVWHIYSSFKVVFGELVITDRGRLWNGRLGVYRSHRRRLYCRDNQLWCTSHNNHNYWQHFLCRSSRCDLQSYSTLLLQTTLKTFSQRICNIVNFTPRNYVWYDAKRQRLKLLFLPPLPPFPLSPSFSFFPLPLRGGRE